MSYNGSGTFNINSTGQPVVAGTVITASAFNALTTDLATGLTTAITKDGQTTTTARITFAQGITSSLTTDSSSVSTGSIITAGGLGVAKALYVGTTANVAGAVTLQGTVGFGGVATFSAQPIFSSLTASSAVATDASKGLVSVTNTGTGNNVLATSPTLVTPALGTPSALVLTNATGLPQTGLGTNVAGNGPAFSAYQSSAQTLSSNTATKLTFTTEEFDTNNNFASSTFTPTVDGYYLVTAGMEVSSSATGMLLYVYKNGSNYKKLTNSNPASISGVNGSAVVYCNGTTDYIEIYGLVATGQALVASSVSTYFQAAMVRAA